MDRAKLISRLAAQYLGRDEEEDDVPWMDYVQKKNSPAKGMSQSVNTVKEMMEGSKEVDPIGTADGQLGENLLDGVNDALSIPHEQDYQPSNENDEMGEGVGNLFPVEFNHQDKEDQPDNSLRAFYKNKHRQDEATGTPWGSNLYGPDVDAFHMEASDRSTLKVAFKTINQIILKPDHHRAEKIMAEGTKLTPTNVSPKDESAKGIFTLKVSGGKSTHTVKMQMLKAEGKSNLMDHPCLIACDCKDFLYGGPQYYASKDKYLYTPMARPQNVEPRDVAQGGRGKGLTFCKHIYSVGSHLTDLHLDAEYSEDLKKSLLDIKDFDKVVTPEKFHLDAKTKFIQFLENDKMHAEVLEEARQQLKRNGVGEHQLYDYVQGPFAQESQGVQKATIQMMGDSPDTIVFLLLEFKKAFGTIPGYLSEIAYETIKEKIS
jgi:hypothetical protein